MRGRFSLLLALANSSVIQNVLSLSLFSTRGGAGAKRVIYFQPEAQRSTKEGSWSLPLSRWRKSHTSSWGDWMAQQPYNSFRDQSPRQRSSSHSKATHPQACVCKPLLSPLLPLPSPSMRSCHIWHLHFIEQGNPSPCFLPILVPAEANSCPSQASTREQEWENKAQPRWGHSRGAGKGAETGWGRIVSIMS